MTAGPQRPSWPHPGWSRPHRSAVLFTIFRAEPFKQCPRQLVPTAHHRVACPSLCWACRPVGYQCAERGGGAPQTLQTPAEPTWICSPSDRPREAPETWGPGAKGAKNTV